MANAAIFNALMRPVRSVDDYLTQYDQRDAQKAQIQQNALAAMQGQQLREMQMAEIQRRAQAEQAAQQRQRGIEDAYRGAYRSPEQMAMAGGGGPTVGNAAKIGSAAPSVDQAALVRGLMQVDPMAAYQMLQPKPADYKVVGDALVSVGPGGVREAYKAQPKPAALPSAIQEFQYAQQNPEFAEYQTRLKKAGATNIGMPKIEVKTGESVASQIGPMAKDSKIQAQGAVSMFDAADRIQRALDSGMASAGPFTTQIQTVKQLVQKVSGGNDEGIRQTRQVIKSLAQMSVEARKQLQGQGQVTESEAAAVAKAEAGDINDLTVGELQDLVTLTKRASHFQAMSHQAILEQMQQSDATKGLMPYYKVQGMDAPLKHAPSLPKIGGSSAMEQAIAAEAARRAAARGGK